MIRKSMRWGFDPMVDTGFPKRSCSSKRPQSAMPIQFKAIALSLRADLKFPKRAAAAPE
jgi:hypothetical protein